MINNADGGFDLYIEEDPSNCINWGSANACKNLGGYCKTVMCRRYPKRNCWDDTMKDNTGKYLYNGRTSTTLTGQTCASWAGTIHEDNGRYTNRKRFFLK